MSLETYKSALGKFYEWEQKIPQQVFLRQAIVGSWSNYTWSQVGREARIMAQALKSMGCEPGDRVAILSKNCAHWIIADLAIMMAACVSVPLYPTQRADALELVLKHSEAKVIFVGKLDDWYSLEVGISKSIPRISFPYPDPMPAAFTWQNLLTRFQADASSYFPLPEDLATIIYTSGTTGSPKGVMHSFASMAHAVIGFQKTLGFHAEDRLFSYLPLSHVAERVLVEMMAIYCGSTIAFAESLEKFTTNLQEVAPTAFFSVPRLWVKFQQGILAKISQKKLDILLSIPGISQLISYKIRKGLGLHKAHAIGSGAAAISPSLLLWYRKIGINILEGYGQTENFGYATVNLKSQIKIGTVGHSLPNSRCFIGENAEIWIKNLAVMQGYYKDPEASKEVLQDGMIRTGDTGEIDADGVLKITGRLKEIFKTDKGKYIAPAPIESIFIADNPYIEQLCVTGNALSQPVALCVLTESARKQPEALILKEFSDSLRRLNQKLERHERIDHCILIRDEWTIDAGMMTPTLKIKRHSIEAKYQDLISKAISSQEPVVWERTLL